MVVKRMRIVAPGKIPILGMASAGDPDRLIMMNEVVDQIRTPAELEGVDGGYGLYVHGNSMEPRYFSGQTVHVHPNKPIAADKFCVVQVGRDPENPDGAFIKQFKGWDGNKLRLAQYNPPAIMEFARDEVISIHRIVGTTED